MEKFKRGSSFQSHYFTHNFQVSWKAKCDPNLVKNFANWNSSFAIWYATHHSALWCSMCPSGMILNDHKEFVQTAESLQPPSDSGQVRRSSDVGLESRTGAQRRRSMAPGLEGGSGGSATSLHRSSSMKQQRSGSFNTGTLSKLLIWQQKRSAKQLPSIILIAWLIFKAIRSPGPTKFPTFSGKQKPMIWDHFEAVSGQQAGRCKACHMTIQCKYNTGQFVRHLQLAHMDIFRKHQSKVQSEWTKSIVEKNISKNTG